MGEPVLELRGVERHYRTPAGALEVLSGVDLSLEAGEIVGLVAPSGAGKSTLLHLAGLLEPPQAGQVLLSGARFDTDRARTEARRQRVGFIYQFHNLLAEFDARHNVAMPLLISGWSKPEALTRADELLGRLGLGARATHQPAELSGGEQQRVAVARAFAHRPGLIIADEPTGNVDPETSLRVFAEFRHAAREEGVAALVATHNLALTAYMDRTLTLREGRLVPWDPASRSLFPGVPTA
jgi:lipoprotein-releasing system ATP-binding protein